MPKKEKESSNVSLQQNETIQPIEEEEEINLFTGPMKKTLYVFMAVFVVTSLIPVVYYLVVGQ